MADLSGAARFLLGDADAAIAATHGLVAPLLAALAAMVVAWLLRQAWRGVRHAFVAVVAVSLAGIICAVAALWPGTQSCSDVTLGALLGMFLGTLAASAVLVGCWQSPRTPLIVKVGLAAMAVGIVLNLVLSRAGLDNAASHHLVAAAVVACVGLPGAAVSRARVSAASGGAQAGEQAPDRPPATAASRTSGTPAAAAAPAGGTDEYHG